MITKVKLERMKQGYPKTARDMHRLAGLETSEVTYMHWEAGKPHRRLKWSDLSAVAEVLGVDPYDIADRDGFPLFVE